MEERRVALQSRGIGRPMKVGKEGIFGVMAALEHRLGLDIDAWQAEQDRKMHTIIERLGGIAGVQILPFLARKTTNLCELCGQRP